MNATAIIAAGGSGIRLNPSTPKQFVSIDGVPVLFHTLRAFERSGSIERVVVVVPQAHLGEVTEPMLKKFEITKVSAVVPGGVTRQASVKAGLDAIDWNPSLVAIHDAARCLVTASLIDRTIQAVQGWDGAVAALPVRDTLKRVRDVQVIETTPRDDLWAMQTPQVFKFPAIRDLYRKATQDRFESTDDAAIAERYGARVRVVEGSILNFKITFSEDLVLAETLLQSRT